MATTASRINNTGTYFINGNFDEITGTIVKVSANTVYARSFDEVTYSNTTPAFKNLLTYTEQFDDASWGNQSGATVTANTITAPNGTLTADTVAGNGTATGYLVKSFSFTAGVSYVFSVYAKINTTSLMTILLYGTNWNSGGGNIIRTFNLSTGTRWKLPVAAEEFSLFQELMRVIHLELIP
jgi:hypothetical protein